MRFAIVVGRFYEDLAERLVAGAQRAFADAGASRKVIHSNNAANLVISTPFLATDYTDDTD